MGHVIRKNGMLVCRMLDLWYPSHGDRQANARLIAEAPAMRDILYAYVNREAYSFAEKQANWTAARDLLARIDGAEVPTPPATCPECGDTLTPPRELAEAGALPPNYCRTCDRQVREED